VYKVMQRTDFSGAIAILSLRTVEGFSPSQKPQRYFFSAARGNETEMSPIPITEQMVLLRSEDWLMMTFFRFEYFELIEFVMRVG
jgi:hypothetical protein